MVQQALRHLARAYWAALDTLLHVLGRRPPYGILKLDITGDLAEEPAEPRLFAWPGHPSAKFDAQHYQRRNSCDSLLHRNRNALACGIVNLGSTVAIGINRSDDSPGRIIGSRGYLAVGIRHPNRLSGRIISCGCSVD